MQSNDIKAFRQRLLRAGFRNISIYNNCDGTYSLYCISPSGESIRKVLTLIQIINIPHIVWFD